MSTTAMMATVRPAGRPRRPLAWLVACGCCFLAVPSAGDEPMRRLDLIRDLPTAGDLSAPANGQTLYVLEESTGRIVAVDPFAPDTRWIAVAPGEKGSVAAIGSIDTGTLVLLCSGPDGWSLRCHRMQPGVTATPDEPAQTVTLGGGPPAKGEGKKPSQAAGAATGRPTIAVSPSRDWLTVTGLPSPAAAVLRAPIAGQRIGSFSTRSCPQGPAAGAPPVAVTVSAADEFVLFTKDPDAAEGSGIFLSFHHASHPRRLLHLDTGLPRIYDAAFCRSDGTLWVVGGEQGSAATPEGLWRIDATLRNGRQEARAVCVAPLDGAVALACLSERAIVVTHGRTSRIVSRIDPTGDAAGNGDARPGAGSVGSGK